MKEKIKWVLVVCTLGSCYAQRSFELSYHGALIKKSPIGKMESPKVYEFGIGLGGGGGIDPYMVFNVGQSRFSYIDTLYGEQDFKGLMCGGVLGFRPFSKKYCIRLQPIVQMHFKTSLFGESKNANGEPEPVMSEVEVNSKLKELAYIGIGTGFEFFLTDRFSISSLFSIDRFKFNESKVITASYNFKISYYISY